MNWFTEHRAYAEILGAVVLLVEQILPHLPMKANSTVQLVLDIATALLPKKGP